MDRQSMRVDDGLVVAESRCVDECDKRRLDGGALQSLTTLLMTTYRDSMNGSV